MRIAIVTPYADPEKGACVLRVNSFKNYFEKKGKIVAILAPKRKYVPEVPLVKRYGGIAGLIKHLVKDNMMSSLVPRLQPLMRFLLYLLQN